MRDTGQSVLPGDGEAVVAGVRRPVTSMRAALPVAAEHFAFCSDNVYQGTGSIREYAKELPRATRWSFWWD